MSFKIKPLTPVIGGEVEGINLAEDVDDAAFKSLKDAFLEHQVLFFRDQDMSIVEHLAFGRRFGDLHVHPLGYTKGPREYPEILLIHADEKTTRTAGDKWHSDVSCEPEPPIVSILKLHKIPPTGGDTLFASMYAAYDALSAPMKQMLDGLTATHDRDP